MAEQKIPKIIHFCWFGGKEKPSKVQECIESWHKYLSDYEFMEWNESNFDINSNEYVKQAYEEKKFAYVSDYARIKALYQYGGILGFDEENYIATSFIASVPRHGLIKEFIDKYENISFYNSDNSLDLTTNVQRLTHILEDRGLVRNNTLQKVGDISIYPQEYFSPYDYGNCIRKNTENTYCEHLFLVSWLPWTTKIKKAVKKIIIPMIGVSNMNKIRQINK